MLYHSDNARLMAVNRQVKEHHVEGRQRLLFKIGRLGKPLPKRRLCLDLITERSNHEKISRANFLGSGSELGLLKVPAEAGVTDRSKGSRV